MPLTQKTFVPAQELNELKELIRPLTPTLEKKLSKSQAKFIRFHIYEVAQTHAYHRMIIQQVLNWDPAAPVELENPTPQLAKASAIQKILALFSVCFPSIPNAIKESDADDMDELMLKYEELKAFYVKHGFTETHKTNGAPTLPNT